MPGGRTDVDAKLHEKPWKHLKVCFIACIHLARGGKPFTKVHSKEEGENMHANQENFKWITSYISM